MMERALVRADVETLQDTFHFLDDDLNGHSFSFLRCCSQQSITALIFRRAVNPLYQDV